MSTAYATWHAFRRGDGRDVRQVRRQRRVGSVLISIALGGALFGAPGTSLAQEEEPVEEPARASCAA